MLSGAGGKGGSSFQQAAGELPPLKSGARAGQGESSFQEPVEAKVIEIDPNREKFTVIQPSVPEMPGTTLPYPTADIRQAMNRPNCTAVGEKRSFCMSIFGTPTKMSWIFLDAME